MSKIKFNKEWYHNSKMVINCETENEANLFVKELAKVGITQWGSGLELMVNNRWNDHKDETCYRLDADYTLSYTDKSYLIRLGYVVIKFSDLEFESDIIDKYLKTMADTKIEAYKALTKSCEVEKSEPIIEFDPPIKRTILRESVELKNGDVFEIIYSNVKSIGIVVDDHVLYNDGTWDGLNITNNITWIIYGEDIKSMSIGYEISRLLFKNKLDDELEDFITYLIDKPKETIKKTVEVFSVKFCKTDLGLSHFISDSEEIFVEDIVSPIRGEHEDLYGEVINIQCKELSEEELKSYNKIIKIK